MQGHRVCLPYTFVIALFLLWPMIWWFYGSCSSLWFCQLTVWNLKIDGSFTLVNCFQLKAKVVCTFYKYSRFGISKTKYLPYNGYHLSQTSATLPLNVLSQYQNKTFNLIKRNNMKHYLIVGVRFLMDWIKWEFENLINKSDAGAGLNQNLQFGFFFFSILNRIKWSQIFLYNAFHRKSRILLLSLLL